MKKKLTIAFLLAAVVCVCSVAPAQEKQPQTNCGLVNMIKAGSTDTAIVPVSQLDGLPYKCGYFYRGGTEWIELGVSSVVRGKLKGVEKTFLTGGIVGPGIDLVYEGPEARMKVTEPRPTFYVHLPGQSKFIDQYFFQSRTRQVIVRLDKKKSSRLLEISPIGVFGSLRGLRFKKKAVNETVVTRVSSDVVAITPKSDLAPGEYLLTVWGPGRHGAEGGYGHDFSVRS